MASDEPPVSPPVIAFTNRDDFAGWLDAQHADAPAGIWLKLAKKGSGIDSITYAEALDIALRYGWIDGQKKGLDESYWLQRFTPRRARSIWSKINRDKATALIELGQMRPAGLREVEAAKADGRWETAYESQRGASVPPELQEALDADPVAVAAFATLDSPNRYAFIFRVATAKRSETKAKRVAEFIAMLHDGRRIH